MHHALVHKVSTEAIMKMIEVGGSKLVMVWSQDKKYTALDYACTYKASTEVIMKIIELGGHYLVMPKKSMKMIELGGPELVIVKNKDGFTPLYIACKNKASTEAIMKMIKVGGRELVMVKNEYGLTALYYACVNKASTEVIMELARGHDSGDEQVKQTVNVAIEATAISQHCSCIYIAVKYGLRWNIHTKELAELHVDEVVNRCDGLTGLRLFMLAAMENDGYRDLSSIYGLMRMSPS